MDELNTMNSVNVQGKSPHRRGGLAVKDLIKIFSQKESTKGNSSKPTNALRQDSATSNEQPKHRNTARSRFGLKVDRKPETPNDTEVQPRVRPQNALPAITTGTSLTEDIREAYETALSDSPAKSPATEMKAKQQLLEARLQEAKENSLQAVQPVRPVAWVGSDVDKPSEPRAPLLIPRNGVRDVLINAEQRVAKSRTRTFEGRTRLCPLLAKGSDRHIFPERHPDEKGAPLSLNAKKGNNRKESSRGIENRQESNDRSLLLLVQDRLSASPSAYLHETLQQLIDALEQKNTKTATSSRHSKRPVGEWDEYDQALLDLLRVVNDDTSSDETMAATIQQNMPVMCPHPSRYTTHSMVTSTPPAPESMLRSSSVYSRSINSSTPAPVDTHIETLLASTIEFPNRSKEKEPAYKSKLSASTAPVVKPGTPHTDLLVDETIASSGRYDSSEALDLSSNSEITCLRSPTPAQTGPPLLKDAKASNIIREVLSVTEIPQDKNAMRDSGVDVWDAEEIEYVRMGIDYADGMG
ncbi:hypothetical protein Q7P37_006368 [Cladosporium fusiforme]